MSNINIINTEDPVEASRVRAIIVRGFYGTERDPVPEYLDDAAVVIGGSSAPPLDAKTNAPSAPN